MRAAGPAMATTAPQLLSLWLVLWMAAGAEAVLLGMLLRRSALGSMIPKPTIKIYRDMDSDHGSGLRSGFKVGIDATFGGNNSPKDHHHHHPHKHTEYGEQDEGLGVKYQHQHDDYKLQQGDYDLHRYQKSPSITLEIRAPEPPEPPTTEPPPKKNGFSLRRIVKRRRKTGRRSTTPPPLLPPPPPLPPLSMLPSYRKELMYPEYTFGPYKGHTLMGFTYDGQEFKS